MKFIILSYNPKYIKIEDMEFLQEELERDMQCEVYSIQHWHEVAEPVYCVQFADTKTEEKQQNTSNQQQPD